MLASDPSPRLTAATHLRRRAVALGSLAVAVAAVVGIVASVSGAGGAPTKRRAASAPPRGPVTIAWVGDITPGSAMGVPPGDGRVQFAHVRRFLRSADLAFGNLEGTYSTGGASKCGGEGGQSCYAFQAPPGHARALRRAGFDAVNLANNHAWDYGATGQAQTTAALRRARVAATGRPGEIVVVRRRGLRVALVGFAAYPWANPIGDLAGARALVRRAAARADLVVVAMHAGAEGADQTHVPRGTEMAFGENRGDSSAFAHAVIDAGADLVVGSGPHVIRGVERYRGRLIAYSLGNFAGWNNFGLGGTLSESGIFKVTLNAAGKPAASHWIPIELTGPGIPKLDRSRASRKLAAELSKQDFGRAAGMICPRCAST
jgi:Bacterial capsule synthesis protein PGA_cap